MYRAELQLKTCVISGSWWPAGETDETAASREARHDIRTDNSTGLSHGGHFRLDGATGGAFSARSAGEHEREGQLARLMRKNGAATWLKPLQV